MQACRRISTIWKTVAVIGMVVFAVSTIRQISGIALADRQGSRGNYHWPAKIPYPKENRYSEAKFKLGRMLFFDPILSGSGNRSCISCHNPGLSWADGQPRAIGLTQETLPMRCPTLLSVAWIPKLGWDGRFPDLESVAMTPITSLKMMNLPENVNDRTSFRDLRVTSLHSTMHSMKLKSIAARSSKRSQHSNAPFYRPEPHSIGGSTATGLRLTNPRSAALICSTVRRIVQLAIMVGPSLILHFTTLEARKMTTSGAANDSRFCNAALRV